MKVTILYGSATGNAEHIAKDLAKRINESSIPDCAFRSADVMECNHFKRKKLMESWIEPPTNGDVKKHALIVVCSTTGNGDAPENAGRFVRFVKKPPPAALTCSCADPSAPLERVAYAVLGLGDTNYDQFCNSAKIIDKKLHDWGAERAVGLACADEATGLEETVEPWTESVLGELEAACRGGGGGEKEGKAENGVAVSRDGDTKAGVDEKGTKKAVPQSVTPAKDDKAPKATVGNNTSSSQAKTGGAALNIDATTIESTNATNTQAPTPLSKSPTPLYILYGSATGNAEHIAKDLAATYNSYLKNPSFLGYFPSVVCCELNQYKKKCLDAWSTPPCESDRSVKHGVIVVCSTTGNADAPENADRFVRWMKRKSTEPAKPFQHCAYSVLGLGDTNYDVFCAVGKSVDKRLADLGGTRATKAACADEATGLEATVEPWVGSVIGKLADVCKGEGAAKGTVASGKTGDITKRAPTPAVVAVAGSSASALAAAPSAPKMMTEPVGKETQTENGGSIMLAKELNQKLSVSNGGSHGMTEEETNAKDESSPKAAICNSPMTADASANDKMDAVTTNNSKSTTLTPSSPAKSPTPLYVLYGSATGNAEHIAKDLASTYNTYLENPSFLGYFSSVMCCELNQYKKKCMDQWLNPPVEGDESVKHGVIVVCSTTGNADAPENADRFVRWMKRKSTEPTKPFQHCAYAVLGLGDTNYDVFCAVGKGIDKRMSELGGTRAMKAACADEATGLEETVEPWVGSVIGKLASVCKGKGVENGTEVDEKAKPQATTEKVAERPSSLTMADEKKVDAEETFSKSLSTATTNPERQKINAGEKSAPATSNVHPATETPDELSERNSADAIYKNDHTTNVSGVSTIRKLQSLPDDSPLPMVRNATLPTMISSLSSCELISEDMQRRPRGNSLVADNMTVSSASSGFLYTAVNPYESTVLDARYLTNTKTQCAEEVAGVLGDDYENAKKLMGAMKLYEEQFPLSPPPKSTMSTVENSDYDQLQCDKNGKRVIELTLSLPDDFTLEYEPGDSVGLIVPNSPKSVNFVLTMLERNHGILPSQKISVDAAHPITVEEAIRSTVDLCSPMKRKRLFLMSNFATDPVEELALRLLSSNCGGSNGKEIGMFQTYIEDQRRSVVDILTEFPSCQSITLEGLLGCLPAIPPRYYSVCSSPLHHRQLKVAFSVVDYLTPFIPQDVMSGRRMAGLATRRLECICSPLLSNKQSSFKPKVQIFPKPTHEFRLPSNVSTPLVLIGPGTGIAPFIGFLSHRQAQAASLESTQAAEQTSEGTWRGGYELEPADLALSTGDARGLNLAVDYMSKHQKAGEIDLFFGCRHSDHDYLYKEELEEFKAAGILNNLYVAFSREPGREKTYVQTLMRKDEGCGKRLLEMILEREASVYVCGDGNAMGRDVQEAIVDLLTRHFCKEDDGPNEGRSRAVAHLDKMKISGRFVLDIWS